MKRSFITLLLLVVVLLSACGTKVQVDVHAPELSPTPRHTPVPSATVASTSTPTPAPTPQVATPSRLVIPAISLNAPVENVSVVSSGDLQTPPEHPWDDVGWYHNGPRPGEEGSAVIDGHLDRPGGYPAVFWNLRYLHAGDVVMVIDARGKTMRFRVTNVVAYPPLQAPLQQIFGTTGGNYLNLITCAGTWVPTEHQTTLRLVVYTVMV